MITISAFKWVPDFARGQVRDLRARWALEEAGLTYRTRLLSQGDQDGSEYRALQPFGQVPILEEDGLVLFESGHELTDVLETMWQEIMNFLLVPDIIVGGSIELSAE